MDSKTKEITHKKFEVAYVACNEELAFTKYPKLLALEEFHSVEIGTAYRSDREGAIFAEFIHIKNLSTLMFFSLFSNIKNSGIL